MYGIDGQNGLIFGIKRFSTNDGPGIRTTVFLKGCPLRCPWCHNPEGQRFYPELLFSESRCIEGCEECLKICPSNIDPRIELNRLQSNRCIIECGKCTEVCPTEAITIGGNVVGVEDVLRTVLSDRIFYEVSGGGVTLSGGEPLSGKAFTLALLHSLKTNGIHIAVETCCYGAPSIVQSLINYVDLFIIDIKFGRPEDYERYASAKDGSLVFRNLRYLMQSKVPKTIRFPCVPGYTDSVENIKAIVNELASYQIENLLRFEVLPYNRLGEGKYISLGRRPPVVPKAYQLNPFQIAEMLKCLGSTVVVLGDENKESMEASKDERLLRRAHS